MRNFYLCFIAMFLFSCSTRKDFTKIKESSVFVKTNVLGLNKIELLTAYGNPVSKDLFKEGGNLIENLYYLEKINDIIITTKIKLKNDLVVEQLTYKLEYSGEKRIKELEYEVQRNRRATLNSN